MIQSNFLFVTFFLKVKEWLQNLGIFDQTVMEQDDELGDGAVPLHHEDSVKNRYFDLYYHKI